MTENVEHGCSGCVRAEPPDCCCTSAEVQSPLPNAEIVVIGRDPTGRASRCGNAELDAFDSAYERAEWLRIYEESDDLPSREEWMNSLSVRRELRQKPGWPWRTVADMVVDLNNERCCGTVQAAIIQQVLRSYPRTIPDGELIETIRRAIMVRGDRFDPAVPSGRRPLS